MKGIALLVLSFFSVLSAQDKILFIRGGSGTVGFFEGGSDEQGASIFNFSDENRNHGWGELATVLEAEKFTLSERSEDDPTPKSPVPLERLNLSDYDVIVFGSNNARYEMVQINALTNYIQNGGAALFIADANFGSNWADSSSSDSQFLAPFGLSSNQDSGTYEVRRSSSDFLLPAHPIFIGVDRFDGEGVSPGRLTAAGPTLPGVTISRLARVPSGRKVARNSSQLFSGNRGPIQSADASDGPLITARYGTGRIAVHFDRNTFFNLNGAGTNINRFDNERYARNLFNWLAGKPDYLLGENSAPRAHIQDLAESFSIVAGEEVSFQAEARDLDGTVSSVELLVNGVSIAVDSREPYEWLFSGLEFGAQELTLRVTDNDGAVTENRRQIIVGDLGNVPAPLDRENWVLRSNINDGAELKNAIDGNDSSRWATRKFQAPGQTLTLDFGARKLFDRVVLETAANPNDYPRGYLLSGSDDGMFFTQLTSNADTPSGSTTSIELDRPRIFRYLKIEQTGSSSNRWWSIHELNVFQPAPGDALPLASWQELNGIIDLDGDPDGDGLNNFFEFALNSNPHFKNSTAPVEFLFQGDKVIISYRRWIVENGIDYLIQTSSDLREWRTETDFELGAFDPNTDGSMNASYICPLTRDDLEEGRYFRLQVMMQ